MGRFEFGRLARCGLLMLGTLALAACEKKREPEPVPVPVPAPPQPKPRPANTGKTGDALGALPFGGLLGGGGPTSDEAQALKSKFAALLVGTWTADLGDGYTEVLTYNPDGTFAAKLTGPTPATASGKYTVVQLVGTKGLKVRLGDAPDARTITVSFDGGELEHPSLRPGVTGTFCKK